LKIFAKTKSIPTPTMSVVVGIGRSVPSVCLSVCLFVRSIAKIIITITITDSYSALRSEDAEARMIPKCSNYRDDLMIPLK